MKQEKPEITVEALHNGIMLGIGSRKIVLLMEILKI